MVLDGASPVLGETPWFPTEWTAARNAFQLVCERSPNCAKLGGSSLSRIAALLASLRLHPVPGTAPGGGTSLVTATATPGTLYLLMSYAGHWPTAYRDLDAAARAYLEASDAARTELLCVRLPSAAPIAAPDGERCAHVSRALPHAPWSAQMRQQHQS